MKKILISIWFIFWAVFLYGQTLTPIPRGNANQIDAFRGINTGLVGTMLTPNDTTNSPATPYYGALTVLPSDAGKDTIPIWMSNGFKWIRFSGSNAFSINDTIYTRAPIAVDRTTLPGKQILYLLHLDGIVSPGYVVWTGFGLNFNVTPADYYLNYREFFSPFALVTLATAPVSNSRIDLFIVDTTANASALTGMAAPSPVAPQTNPSSQLPLTTVTINAGDTVPSGINLETIYNNHVAPPTEWLPTTNGSIAADFDNTANFYIPPKAAFISVYGDGSNITFTKGSGVDTVQTGEIIRGFIYFNVPFVNQLQFQWFNGSTAVSNSIAINSGYGINPNNTTQYQIFAIPLNAWNFTQPGQGIFNKLVITMAGADSSGAGGFYLDYLQLQTGLLNIDQTPPPAWLLAGNAGTNPANNFIGTTDANTLRFKVNNVHSGFMGIGANLDMAMGYNTLPLSSVTFHDNTAFGANSLSRTNALGFGNVGVGTYALNFNSSGSNNVANGVAGLFSNTTGYSNTGIGTNALYNNTTGHANTALGDSALRGNTTGHFNIGLGYKAAITNTTTSNTFSISDSTPHMFYAIDTITGTAPSIIGYDPVTHRWGHYANSGGGSGGGLANFYLKDSSFSSDRTADLNGHVLQFFDATNLSLTIDPNNGSVDMVTPLSKSINVSDAADLVQMRYDGSTKIALTANTATYTADTHNFIGGDFNFSGNNLSVSLADDGVANIGIGSTSGTTYTQDSSRIFFGYGNDGGANNSLLINQNGNTFTGYTGVGATPTALFQVTDPNTSWVYAEIDPANFHSFITSLDVGNVSNGIIATVSDSLNHNVRSYMQATADGANVPTVETNGTNNTIVLSTPGLVTSLGSILFQDSSLIAAVNGYVWTLFDKNTGKGKWLQANANGITAPYRPVSSATSAGVSDYTINATSGTFTVTLPSAAAGNIGKIYVVTNSGSGTVTVSTTGGQTFGNVLTTPTSLPLAQFTAITIQSTGSGWLRLTNL